MKNFVKIFLVFALVVFTTNSWSQDKNNPWQFSFGTSALNFNGTNVSGPNGKFSNELFDEYFNFEEHWNTQETILSTLSLSRYAGNGFSIGLRASINKFNKLSDNYGEYPQNRLPNAKSMISADLMVIKDFSEWSFYKFEPFVELGAGQSFVGKEKDYFINAGVGVHYPISEKVAIKFNTTYRKNFKNEGLVHYSPNLLPHFQHNLGISINFGGKDSDKDGIYDQHDDCPQVPGLPLFNGCPDSDGDGIEDSKDACPETPGLLEFNGCADSDGDGVADPMDKCPAVAGLSKFDGCPDSDGDGIEDAKDACPNEAGPRRFNGCPDSDGDGVADPQDKCPNDAGPADNDGCPEPTEEIMAELNAVGAGVPFELNKSDITPNVASILDLISPIIKKYANSNFLIEGHTDTSGPKAFNQVLSERRAESVKSYLVSSGIAETRLSTVGYGEERPAQSNNTRKGRIANRRVEFKVVE
jgi:OOP family OmpA-OmpF porin|tara:strand:- start:646 stop:2058 length:1413 start_codon:yes stop_codon:yes gene_type:complete